MTSLRTGSRALGLAVTWRYSFLPAGSSAQPCRDAVYLDVGGQICPGILDQHHDGQLGGSTAELVLRFGEHAYGHLMDSWVSRRDDGQDLSGRSWSPALVTHREPDFDALVACYLVRHLIENGELPSFAQALVGYTTLVDQGRYPIDLAQKETTLRALHLAYLALQNVSPPRGRESDDWHLERGFELLDVTFDSLRLARNGNFAGLQAKDIGPTNRAAGAWREDPRFADLAALLDHDHALYEKDKLAADIEHPVRLPAENGGEPIEVPAFVALKPMESKLNKYWVRADNFPYFICPYANWNDVPRSVGHYPRAIISLDPLWAAAGRKPTLQGLGFKLERAEAAVRQELSGLAPRGATPRWDDGSVDNDDPWYDGRGHDYSIIDAPRSGTFLAYADIRAIAIGKFWHLPVDEALVYILLPVTAPERVHASIKRLPSTMDSFGPWFDDCRKGVVQDVAQPQPPGFVVESEHIRAFPRDLIPPMRVVRLRVQSPGSGTLDDLVHWAQALDEANENRVYLLAQVHVSGGRALSGRVDAMLQKLCLGSAQIAPSSNGKDLVLFNRRAVAVKPATVSTKPREDEASLLLELLLFAAFQAEALAIFSAKAVTAIAKDGKSVEGGRKLRSDFLVFDARYCHLEVVRESQPREVYLGLREALGLERLHDKVSEELDRLEQLERDEADSKKDILLFLVALTGLQQAVFSDWRAASGTTLGVLGTLVVAAIAVYYFLTRDKAAPARVDSAAKGLPPP